MENYNLNSHKADERDNKTDSDYDPNKTLSPEDIAKLFAAQAESEPAVETVPETAVGAVPETAAEVSEPVEAVETAVPEPVAEVEAESAPDPNKPLSPEDIAKLFAAQAEPETVEAVETTVPEPVAEVEAESVPDPNKPLSPEDIAKLFAAQAEPEVAETVEAAVPEPFAEVEAEPAPELDPNKPLSPEDIAKLFAAQAEPEAAEKVFETVEAVETAIPEHVAAVEAEPAPEPDPNKPLSPEDIAKLFAAQTEPEAAEEVAEMAEAFETAVSETAESVETAMPESVAEVEAEQEPDPDPIESLSPEDITTLFAAQAEPEVPEEVAETLGVEQTNIPKTDTSPEVFNTSEDTVSSEDIPAVTVSDKTAIEEKVSFISQLISRLKNKLPKKETPTVDDNAADGGAEETGRKEKANSVVKLISTVKKALSKKQKPRVEDIASDSGSAKADKKEKANIIGKLIGAVKKPLSKKVSQKTKAARSDENTAENSVESVAIKEAPKSEKPRKKSGLKTALAVIGILFLMTGSFTAGFFARDYITLPGHDPAKLKAKSEANTKKAQEEKKAKELAEISPKDYTSSMYLDSIILKGKAEKTTTIKLKRIDNISKITEFPNLRKIKLDGMTGNEDLSVIQELKGLEEITIENSVIRNQFKNGSYASVTYLEMYDSTVEDSSQFANFKGLTELYIYSTKFPSATGNLELTAYLPAAQNITLSSCGEYEELTGAKNLNHLKTLILSSKTMIRNMSYTENPKLEKLKVDVSFAENTEQLQKLADMQNIKSMTIQAKRDSFSSSQLSSVKQWIKLLHPDATVEISTY